jgi:hypothetical protein
MTANAGDLIDVTKDDLPVSSISVFVTGFVVDPVQNEEENFRSIKIVVTEFVGGVNTGKKFYIKCRYLKTDERIEIKTNKLRKNSNIMITGELSLIGSEFKIEIQDINYLSSSITTIESTTGSSTSSLYSWPTRSSSRMSAQELANTLTTPQNSNANSNEIVNNEGENSPQSESDDTPTNTSANIQSSTRRKRKKRY